MSDIEIIVATMNQKDLSLFEKMNAQTDILISNQNKEYCYEEKTMNDCLVRMISTGTKGVGINRNIGLQNSKADILLLADDDIVYHDNYAEIIREAFEKINDADVIIFRMRFIKNGKVYDVDKHKTRRLSMRNGLSFGTYQIAIRKKSMERANLHFTHLFGGGTIYSSGEDSLFLIDCFRAGLKVYSYEGLIGDNIRDSSTWFNGFNEKFFYDRGAFIACAFPKQRYLISLYYVYVYMRKKENNIKGIKMWKMMQAGFKGYKKLMTYEEWKKYDG